jgi:hypothetical protein
MKYLAIIGFVGAASCILTNFPGSANAGGLIGDVVNYYVPGAGTALDSANRRIRNQTSSASVWNQTNEYLSPGAHPMARAARYPQQQPSAPPISQCFRA